MVPDVESRSHLERPQLVDLRVCPRVYFRPSRARAYECQTSVKAMRCAACATPCCKRGMRWF
jgi:hypothetical protein